LTTLINTDVIYTNLITSTSNCYCSKSGHAVLIPQSSCQHWMRCGFVNEMIAGAVFYRLEHEPTDIW